MTLWMHTTKHFFIIERNRWKPEVFSQPKNADEALVTATTLATTQQKPTVLSLLVQVHNTSLSSLIYHPLLLFASDLLLSLSHAIVEGMTVATTSDSVVVLKGM